MTVNSDAARVAVLVAEGLEEIEGLTVVDLLFRAGIPCDTVSITKELTVTSSHKVTIVCDRSIADDDFDFAAYSLVVLPGGVPGTPNLAACKPLAAELRCRFDEGLPVAAICAAPTILAELGLLEGRHATCYPDRLPVLQEHGAIIDAGSVVVDGNLTTSQGMGTAIDFGLSLIAQIKGQEEAGRISRAIVYTE
ncbi:MAG: DJ-1/PfpI family protein [Atopobiaceae bacterium]|nr:DJ-1/PfpI family protein [Atopobiaceae bacterium]